MFDLDYEIHDLLSEVSFGSGAAVDRFKMNRLTLSSKNVFSFVPDGVFDDTWYVVTVRVSDGKFSTDAVVYITVVPWSTTKATTPTTVSATLRPHPLQ